MIFVGKYAFHKCGSRYENIDVIVEGNVENIQWDPDCFWTRHTLITPNTIPSTSNNYTPNSKQATSSGCYVATCIYGSYDCPEVWTLRRFRDNTLAKSWYGRAFIHMYYAVSPTIVRWFGGTDWFKKLWKGKLDRMVTDLQQKGVKSTPYEDQNW